VDSGVFNFELLIPDGSPTGPRQVPDRSPTAFSIPFDHVPLTSHSITRILVYSDTAEHQSIRASCVDMLYTCCGYEGRCSKLLNARYKYTHGEPSGMMRGSEFGNPTQCQCSWVGITLHAPATRSSGIRMSGDSLVGHPVVRRMLHHTAVFINARFVLLAQTTPRHSHSPQLSLRASDPKRLVLGRRCCF
jgi:hypothetical protein